MTKYKQLKNFNTKTTAPPGWCLNHVQRGFNAPWSGSTATQGWELTKYKHKNKSFPEGVWVPVWFSMKGEPAGHVVAYKKGAGLYSASDQDEAGDFHPSLEHLTDYYGGRLSLRGWSEDLNGTRVVQKEKEDEMYKGNTAKYWYEKYIKATKERTTYRNRLVKVLANVTNIVKNRGK